MDRAEKLVIEHHLKMGWTRLRLEDRTTEWTKEGLLTMMRQLQHETRLETMGHCREMSYDEIGLAMAQERAEPGSSMIDWIELDENGMG